jgi:predicted site-specific integrase-resolvase
MPATAPADQLFPLAEAADKLRVAAFTLRHWCLKGKVPYIRLGRQIMLLESDINSFVRSNRVEAK